MLAAGICPLAVVGQVNLPEGFEVVEFLVSDAYAGTPRINNCGEIVVRKDRGEKANIFLYDNGGIRTVAKARGEFTVALPDINDAGTIVWLRVVYGVPGSGRIVVLQDGRESVLGHRAGKGRINNLGHVAWQRHRRSNGCHYLKSIMLYDGKSSRRIFRSRWTDQAAELNDQNQITWMHSDFCQNPWIGDIRLYSDGEIIVLPSAHLQVAGPTINNVPQVAWDAAGAIEIWQNGGTKKLVEAHASVPSLNNLGDMYFAWWDLDRALWQPWLYRVSAGEPVFHRLADDDLWVGYGHINDWAEAVWRFDDGISNAGGIKYLRRIHTGDVEFDGDVDLIDFGAFAACMTGPGRVDRLCDCRFLDIDHDGDVDLGDFALFQNGFTGKK